MKNIFRYILAMSCLALILVGINRSIAQASSDENKYVFLIGKSSSTVPLCDLSPSACPDIAMASDGQFIEISGMGTINIQSNSVAGKGKYTHHFLDGFTVDGIWTAEKLLSYESYGCKDRKTLGLVCGGEALIQVHIVAEGGLFVGDGILQVNSLIGDFPSGAVEGVQLDVPGVITFNNPVSGRAVFYPFH